VRLLAVLLVLAAATPALAREPGKAAGGPTPAQAKKHLASLRAQVGKPPAPVITVRNGKTREILPLPRTTTVTLPQAVVNGFFRDHYTDAETVVDGRLPGILARAAINFDVDRV
jgi:hypothetical protein